MNHKLIALMFVSGAALTTATGLQAADESKSRETEFRTTQPEEAKSKEAQYRDMRAEPARPDLHEEVASPIAGEFTPSTSTMRSGWQQDVGGMSGNANGMDGYPTASGEPSTYPAPDGTTTPGSTTGGY